MLTELTQENMFFWSFGVTAGVVALVVCRIYLTRDFGAIRRTWKGLLPLLEERCYLARKLSAQMRRALPQHAHLVNDIEYVLDREAQSADANRHAAVQNGLVLTVQTALDEYHRNQMLHHDSDVQITIEAIGVLDSRIAPRRDRYNTLVARHNERMKHFPFSILAKVLAVRLAFDFPMLIPWWSTDDRLYSGSRAQQIKHMWETWKSPMIVPPSLQHGQSTEEAGLMAVEFSRGAPVMVSAGGG